MRICERDEEYKEEKCLILSVLLRTVMILKNSLRTMSQLRALLAFCRMVVRERRF